MVVTKHGKAIGMIKTDDMAEFMTYMETEMGKN
jgi:Mg/Co/Ni transporter MgtE